MQYSKTNFALKLGMVVAMCAQLLLFSNDLGAQQVNPRGVPRVAKRPGKAETN